jgi:hypothetical protein
LVLAGEGDGMLQRSMSHPSQTPGPRLRVLVEDTRLAALPLDGATVGGADVAVCSGPHSESEPCPLVTEGRCPMGSFDAVVCALDGPWAHSVRRAWSEQNAVVANVDPDVALDVNDQLKAHVGAALQAVFRAQYLTAPQDPRPT